MYSNSTTINAHKGVFEGQGSLSMQLGILVSFIIADTVLFLSIDQISGKFHKFANWKTVYLNNSLKYASPVSFNFNMQANVHFAIVSIQHGHYFHFSGNSYRIQSLFSNSYIQQLVAWFVHPLSL